jgi:hypothetical protein
MGRQARIAIGLGAAALTWSPVAHASGHELNALGDLIELVATFVASVPWLVSCGLLLRKPTVRGWFFGTATSALAGLLVGMAGAPAWAIGLAVLPAAGHQLKLVLAGGAGPEDGSDKPRSDDARGEVAAKTDGVDQAE